MSDDSSDDSLTSVRSTEAEIKELMGLFDSPAFARRGRDIDWAVARTLEISRRQRLELLEMVHCRLRMWVAVTTGPHDWQIAFVEPIEYLWPISEAPAPTWNGRPSLKTRAVQAASRNLVTSLERFNNRWEKWVNRLESDTINRQIDHYNKYYVLEKECVVGSAKLASRLFKPVDRISPDWLLGQLPLIKVPQLK
ncbi:MAG: hypothetical protein ACKO5E_13345 [bacterium]